MSESFDGETTFGDSTKLSFDDAMETHPAEVDALIAFFDTRGDEQTDPVNGTFEYRPTNDRDVTATFGDAHAFAILPGKVLSYRDEHYTLAWDDSSQTWESID